jgi:hypothetical protein
LKAIQKKKSEKVKEIFKENWLKYRDYEKCIEELKKRGISVSYKYLTVIRKKLNLPRQREFLKNKKCFYCNNPAEKISHKFSSTSKPIFLCKKCYQKIYWKRIYEKHRIKILKKFKIKLKQLTIYLGGIECPKCLNHGLLQAIIEKVVSTGHIVGAYFEVVHQYYINGIRKYSICYIGKNEDLEKRIPRYLLECNCKKCKLKRGEINGSNTKEERI